MWRAAVLLCALCAVCAGAAVLGIYAFQDRSYLTAGFPTYRLHYHVRRLVLAGHKVGSACGLTVLGGGAWHQLILMAWQLPTLAAAAS